MSVLPMKQTREVNPEIVMIDIGRLMPNPLNPRGEVNDSDVLELMRSIKETNGPIQPLVVTPYRDAYYIVAGHRRRHASKLAGLTKLPCIIRECTEEEQEDLMLVENIQRQDLNPLQEAQAFQRKLSVYHASISDIVKRVGVSEPYIKTRLAILSLDSSVKELFRLGVLPIGAAPVLALCEDVGRQRHYATLAVASQIPLHKLEQMVRESASKPKRVHGKTGPHKQKKKVLGEYEVFTRSEAVHELAREGAVSYQVIAESFADICDGVCVEDDGNRAICEACPAPRLIASLLRRTGVEIKGRSEV